MLSCWKKLRRVHVTTRRSGNALTPWRDVQACMIGIEEAYAHFGGALPELGEVGDGALVLDVHSQRAVKDAPLAPQLQRRLGQQQQAHLVRLEPALGRQLVGVQVEVGAHAEVERRLPRVRGCKVPDLLMETQHLVSALPELPLTLR